ncbi:putative GH43/DUF377 family glycosyl hydrolase [Catenulispora sp. EB89]|uniref:glycoside hydrolase family 130 protein n=1 Tax=Catenulispora sp. EB89 TaxID=3156257 RepID=UPI0035180B92
MTGTAVRREEPTIETLDAAPHNGVRADLVVRGGARLRHDPRRVVTDLFVPGEELPGSVSRAAMVFERIMALDDDTVDRAYTRTLADFSTRHRDLEKTFAEHSETVGHRIAAGAQVSDRRRLLIGAYFTREYAIEAAALTNPSLVEHPDQSGLAPGCLRFVLSARAIGEGHLSCVEFRTGVIGPDGTVAVDEPSRFASAGRPRASRYDRRFFEHGLAAAGDDNEVHSYLLHRLPAQFTDADLEHVLADVPAGLMARNGAHAAIESIRLVAACQYVLEFPQDTDLSERVLRPISPTDSRGMEDARFVRFVDEGGAAGYRATYNAFDGFTTAPQLIETEDLRVFRVSPLLGPAARNKGMALFPRLVGGVHMALSRWDRESTSVATSADGRVWGDAQPLRRPELSWDLVQRGNCGSPIETPEGWLVLTHGVGPMRVYGIGAMMLDLEDPRKVVGSLNGPLLTPDAEERDGYVPNVVYSCGAIRHGENLVIPYGFSDVGIGFATVRLPELIDAMRNG